MTILASPGEVIRDHKDNLLATVVRPIYLGTPMDPEDFEWAVEKPKPGEKAHIAFDYFIARKKRLL
jgi:hypothetical protein